MTAALSLRTDYDSATLRRLSRTSEDADQTRRLLALAMIYDGVSRTQAAEVGGVGRQIVRDWVERFNAQGPDGLQRRKAPGKKAKLNKRQRSALSKIVEAGPIPAIHGVVRWRLIDLAQWIYEEYEISIDLSTVSRELKALGFVKITARPRHHAQNELAQEDFKKVFRTSWTRSGPRSHPARK